MMRFLEWFGDADGVTQLFVLWMILIPCAVPVLIVGMLTGVVHG